MCIKHSIHLTKQIGNQSFYLVLASYIPNIETWTWSNGERADGMVWTPIPPILDLVDWVASQPSEYWVLRIWSHGFSKLASAFPQVQMH